MLEKPAWAAHAKPWGVVICNPPEGSPAYEAGFAEGDRVFNFGKCVSAADLGPVIDGLLETKVPCVVLDAEDRYVRKFITPRQWNPDAPKSVLGVTCARAPLSPGRHPCLTRPNLDAVCGRYNTLIDPLLQFGVDDRVKCLLMFEEECTHDHSHVHGPNCDHGEPSLSPRSTSTPTSTLPPGLSFRQITTASRATATHTTTRTMRTGTCTAQTAITVSQAFSPRSTSAPTSTLTPGCRSGRSRRRAVPRPLTRRRAHACTHALARR